MFNEDGEEIEEPPLTEEEKVRCDFVWTRFIKLLDDFRLLTLLYVTFLIY